MKHYAIYDKKTGHIVHLHKQVDLDERSMDVPEHEVLALLRPDIDKDSVAVAVIELTPESGSTGGLRIDPKTHKLHTP